MLSHSSDAWFKNIYMYISISFSISLFLSLSLSSFLIGLFSFCTELFANFLNYTFYIIAIEIMRSFLLLSLINGTILQNMAVQIFIFNKNKNKFWWKSRRLKFWIQILWNTWTTLKLYSKEIHQTKHRLLIQKKTQGYKLESQNLLDPGRAKP